MEVMKEVSFGGTSGSSMSSNGSTIDDNGNSLASLDQASLAKIAFFDNVTSCLMWLMEAMNNQTKQQADAIMMQYFNHQNQIEMAKKAFGAN